MGKSVSINIPEEGTCKSIKKFLRFNSGETLSIELHIKNVSPQISKDTIIPMFDALFEMAKEDI